MLTRLHVDGFKNLHDVTVEFGAFTCVAGANAVGKSNLFDAIEFLSLLADHPLMEAAQQVRGIGSGRSADPRDLFWNGYGTASAQPIQLTAEMIVPHEIEDDFGDTIHATITYLRYHVELDYEPPVGGRRIGRLVLLTEELGHINIGEAPRRLGFPYSAKQWRSKLLRGRRSGTAFISTEGSGTDRQIKVHQDGGSRGQPRVAAAVRSPSTVVHTTTQSSDPTILAARREMQSWRRIGLVPAAMRTPDSYSDPQRFNSDGRHLAATLYRIAESAGESPDDVYARVATRLAALVGVDVGHLRVDADDARETLTLLMKERSGIELPARSLSEGTLRFVALCVLFEDPTVTGLLCVEEPENGIHPLSIGAMVDLVRDLAVDPKRPPGPDNPMRQLIVNTHSPAVVQLVGKEDLLYADLRAVEVAGYGLRHGLRLRPVRGGWRDRGNAVGVGKAELIAYLSHPPGAQLSLETQDANAA